MQVAAAGIMSDAAARKIADTMNKVFADATKAENECYLLSAQVKALQSQAQDAVTLNETLLETQIQRDFLLEAMCAQANPLQYW
jgi:NAD kinase